jgi:alpha-2-macroglobulin
LTSRSYFESRTRPIARILTATIAVEPAHALLGPLVETLLQNRTGRGYWNTQDLSSSAAALAAFEQQQRSSAGREVRVRAGSRALLASVSGADGSHRDAAMTLTSAGATSADTLRLSLDAAQGAGAIYYYLSVTEIPLAPPVTPENKGIQVERWYETMEGGKPITSVAEGDLVRVRLRISVPVARYFVIVDDPLPAGLEAVDLSLRTASAVAGPGAQPRERDHEEEEPTPWYGRWDAGWWTPFDHREIRDDRVVYSANLLWRGTYTATYIARATTPGTFIRPPVHSEEMYNPAVYGRSDGGTFVVTAKGTPR